MSTIARFRIVCIVVAATIVLISGLAIVACHYRIYSWRDYQVYGAMEKECHPVWREFNSRRIGPGADLTEVVNSTRPARIVNYGDFAVLSYQEGPGLHFTGVGATAYQGRLVEAAAWSCCWTKTFFDVRSQKEKDLMVNEYEAYMKPIRERWAHEAEEEKRKEAQNGPRNEIDP